MREKLEKKLKEFSFDNENNDIRGVMSLVKAEEDMEKMYNYIIDNNITDTDDIYRYGFKLAGLEAKGVEIVDDEGDN